MPGQQSDVARDDKFGRLVRFRADELDGDQRQILDVLEIALKGKMPRAIVDEGGAVTGGFNYLLLDPAVGDAFTKLGNAITRNFAPRLRELVILEASRALRSDYEWIVHAALGRKAGLTDEEIDAIRDGDPIPTLAPDERIARQLTAAVLADRHVPDELYDEAMATLGNATVYDVVMQAGYYALMCTSLTTFQAPLPGNAAPVFAD